MTDKLIIRGAAEHNLKHVDLELPKGRLIVFTGVSGSGKTSLAFDTLYKEGQRRYLEALSSYARQFIGGLTKPKLEALSGVAPAISIEQKTAGRNPRSTVATLTEIYDYLRVLYANCAVPHCPVCGRALGGQSVDEIVATVRRTLDEGRRFAVLAPIARERRGHYREFFVEAARQGFVRARVDGEIVSLTPPPELDRYSRHNLELVVDRLVNRPDIESRLASSIETALAHSREKLVIIAPEGEDDLVFSQTFACPACGLSFDKLTPQNFSFNHPSGWCPTCYGLGYKWDVDLESAVDEKRSLREGAVPWWGRVTRRHPRLGRLVEALKIDVDAPFGKLPEPVKQLLLFGARKSNFPSEALEARQARAVQAFAGLVGELHKAADQHVDEAIREKARAYFRDLPCPACKGGRLRPEALAATLGGKSLPELCALKLTEAEAFLQRLQFKEVEALVAQPLVKEVLGRLKFLIEVGLEYLTLDRPGPTLSGGEAQRVRLAGQLGAGLTEVLYVLDEPTIGLHQRDNERLIGTLQRLRDLGNTVVVVEHDRQTIEAADFVVDFGPGPGVHGGEILYAGPLKGLLKRRNSLTADYLMRRKEIPVPKQRVAPDGRWLVVKGARKHNLKRLTVRFPVGLFCCVSGVSGSGKSTLVNQTLLPALRAKLEGRRLPAWLECEDLKGAEAFDRVVEISQSPIGRTPRSNPATYVKAFDDIRKLFAQLPLARQRGYTASHFSFNTKAGRCEACGGQGQLKLEMRFVPEVWVECEVCRGKRFMPEILEVLYKGKSIADVLEMTVEEALDHFANIPALKRKLGMLNSVGLGYLKLGQPSPTLSGGEAQRIKLARELAKTSHGRTLYLLDEPTTGLHFADVQRLLEVLLHLRDLGNTVVVIEHNPEVLKVADWLVDLGPGAGDEGGEVVAEGPPEVLAKHKRSLTGKVLRAELALVSAGSKRSKGGQRK